MSAARPEPVVIVNPSSGRGGGSGALSRALAEAGFSGEVRETTRERGADALAREAKDEGATEIVVCGGDGSLMGAVNGIGADSGVTLGVVPMGTANLVAAGLGLSSAEGDMASAVRVALSGEVRTVDLGSCGGTLFALGVGLGLTERFVTETDAEAKARIGRWAYVLSLARELGARPHSFSLTLDGGEPVESRGVALVIANLGSLGGGLRFAPDARPDDGILDVCVLRRFGLRDALGLLWSLTKGDLAHDRALAFFKTSRVEFDASPPLEVQIDGDRVESRVPLVAEVLPGALRVRVPPGSSGG